MSPLSQLLYLFAPMVLAGISNMVWMKLPILFSWQRPMDAGRNWKDERRIFGDNKTWKGFIGMILVTACWLQIFACLDQQFIWAQKLSLLPFEDWPYLAWFYGAVWGLFYVLAELPNSFVKRRLGISAGQGAQGALGTVFKFIDQSDSVLGCLLGMLFFYKPSLVDFVAIFVLATAFHFLTNILLYLLGLKKQAG